MNETAPPSMLSNQPSEWKCNQCPKKFAEYVFLNLHVVTKHVDGLGSPEQVVQQCGVCPKKFTLKEHMKVHMEKMHGAKLGRGTYSTKS